MYAKHVAWDLIHNKCLFSVSSCYCLPTLESSSEVFYPFFLSRITLFYFFKVDPDLIFLMKTWRIVELGYW